MEQEKSKLHIYMRSRSITNDSLAQGTKIKYPTLSKYIYGTIKNPSVANIKKITAFLGCTFEDVF